MSEDNETGVSEVSAGRAATQNYASFGLAANARSIPDARDGFKPVHRRILEITADEAKARYVKSAKIVGSTLGRRHPHGDSSVYDAAVRLTLPWVQQVPLLDGQGNFGSITGDRAASMRYTELRLDSSASWLVLDGLEDGAVAFRPNYDESEQEPVLMPVKIPILLLNGIPPGSIGSGYASAVPTHNPSELADAAAVLIRAYMGPPEEADEETVLRDILAAMPGPDFPTGGVIGGPAEIEEAYRTGRGTLKVRCDATIDGDRNRIIVTAVPYGIGTERLVDEIGEAILGPKDPKTKVRAAPLIPEAKAVRDETTVDGNNLPIVRIVVELKQGEDGPTALEKLYRHTGLQGTFPVNMTALSPDGRPRLYNLLELLQEWLGFRVTCVRRAASGRLRNVSSRIHSLEGVILALGSIDDVIKTIRGASSDEEMIASLMEMGLTSKQAETVGATQLRRLAKQRAAELGAELDKLRGEEESLVALISNPSMVYEKILAELEEFKRRFPRARRTRIASMGAEDPRSLIAPEESILAITGRGYLRRFSSSEFRAQHRGGKGKQGTKVKADDALRAVHRCHSRDRVFAITDRGRVARLEAYEVPDGGSARFANSICDGLAEEERIAALLCAPMPSPEYDEVVLASDSGYVKRVMLNELTSKQTKVLNLYKGIDGSPVMGAAILPSGDGHIFLASQAGLGTRFSADDVRLSQRDSGGVKGMELAPEGGIVSMSRITDDDFDGEVILCVASDGYGKKVAKDQFPVQNRGGKGRILIKTRPGAKLVAALVVREDDDIVVATRSGMTARFRAGEVKELGRSALGVKIMALKEGDEVVAAAALPPEED